MGGQVDHWEVEPIADGLGRLDAIHLSPQTNVHEDEFGPQPIRCADRIFS
jgi:hypothetical protein